MRKKKKTLRRELEQSKKIIIVLIVILILLALVFVLKKTKDTNANNQKEVEVKVEDTKKEYKISLLMAGDMLVHDSIYEEAHRLANNNGYNFKPMLTYIKDIVKDYDLAYYNQETILGGTELGLTSYPAFNSPYEVGDDMIDAGFNIVSLATNHTLDRGIKAIENSLNYWHDKDVYVTGSYLTKEERDNIVIKEKNNITYAVLNYTYGTNGIKRPDGYDSYVNIWDMSNKNNYENYKEQVKLDINKLRDKVDILMVAMHWGNEYNLDTTWYQEDAAEFLSNEDVDIIIGSHPHVIEPIKWIDDTLVIYSLGNFLSAHQVKNIDNRVGLMTTIDIVKEVDKDITKIKLDNLNNDLIYTYYDNYRDFKVIPFSNKDINKYLNNPCNIHDKYKNIITKLDSNIIVKECYK